MVTFTSYVPTANKRLVNGFEYLYDLSHPITPRPTAACSLVLTWLRVHR
jgi:hypothetical protein